MTIRKLSYIFYLTTGVLISLLTLFMVLRFFESRKLDDALNVRYASFLAADELRQSSDDLTRMARAYVVTGDPKFEQYYWDILAIRNGEKETPLQYERSYWDLVMGDPGFEPTPGRAEDFFTIADGRARIHGGRACKTRRSRKQVKPIGASGTQGVKRDERI